MQTAVIPKKGLIPKDIFNFFELSIYEKKQSRHQRTIQPPRNNRQNNSFPGKRRQEVQTILCGYLHSIYKTGAETVRQRLKVPPGGWHPIRAVACVLAAPLPNQPLANIHLEKAGKEDSSVWVSSLNWEMSDEGLGLGE